MINTLNIKFYFPNWIFPNNIGDTIISTFIPKLIKQLHPDHTLEVIVHGKLFDIMKYDDNIDICRLPNNEEMYYDFKSYALGEVKSYDFQVAYPDWHPNLFTFWQNNHDYLVNHPTANIITVNFLLQLGYEHLLFDAISYDFRPYFNKIKTKLTTDSFNLGIVISTKLAGKGNPHPGCNGIGYRYKLESWREFVKHIKQSNPNIQIYEFSETFMHIGDVHNRYTDSFNELFDQIDQIDLAVVSDGGLHHAFNARNTPLVLFQPNILSKVEFLKLDNSYYPEHLHLNCRKSCRSYFSEVFGGNDMSTTCNMECENLDPIELAKYTNNIIEKIKNESNKLQRN